MEKKKVNLAVLIGRGGRLPAIHKCTKGEPLIDLVLVISHKKESPGINLAKKWSGREASRRKRGLRPRIEAFYCMRKAQPSPSARDMRMRPCEYLNSLGQRKTRKECERELAEILKKRRVNLVVMAGWDLIMSGEFLRHFPGRVINIHPSLCPAFPGTDAEKQALDYGAKYTGCTLHFVDRGVDTGPIILQRVVEIEPNDTVESLQKKIHKKEDEILCKGIKLFAQGKLKIKERRVLIN